MESRIFSEQILDWSKLLEKQDVVKSIFGPIAAIINRGNRV